MAASAIARRLTETHRLAQTRLGTRTVAAMRATWPLLDLEDVDGTFDRWLAANLPLIRGQRAESARLAANYLATFKALELGAVSQLPTVLASQTPIEAVSTSLLVTGPVRVKSATARGLSAGRVNDLAQSATARAAMRHVLDAGRDTILQTVDADRDAIGWARATSGQPCGFCAMVASRGPVYKSESSVTFEPHDGCSCTAEPVYRDDAAWPAGSDRWRQMWEQAAGDDGDTRLNFRRLVETS